MAEANFVSKSLKSETKKLDLSKSQDRERVHVFGKRQEQAETVSNFNVLDMAKTRSSHHFKNMLRLRQDREFRRPRREPTFYEENY